MSWKGPARIMESNCWPHTGPPQNQTQCLRALSRHSLNFGTRGRAHSPGQPVPCPPPSGADPVPNPQLPLPWHSSMPFPRALSLSHRAELSAAPPLPVRSCSHHEASPQLLCSALSQPRDLSHSSYILPSGLYTSFIALLWRLSNSFMSFSYCGTQTCTQCRRWGCTVQSREINPFPYPAAVLGLEHPRVQLALGAAGSYCWLRSDMQMAQPVLWWCLLDSHTRNSGTQ